MRELDAPEQRASPRGETFPLHQVPAKRDQAASDTEIAPSCTGLPGTHKASCAPPRCTAAGGSLRTRPKRGAQQRARCGASGDSGPERLHHVTIEATSQRGELSFPICGTAAARNCRDGAYRLMEGRFRGTRQRAIRRRRLHRRSHLHQLRPPTMWSERRYPLMIERSGSGSLQRPSRARLEPTAATLPLKKNNPEGIVTLGIYLCSFRLLSIHIHIF